MGDNKNIIMAVGLSIAIMLGFQYFYEKPRQEEIIKKIESEKKSNKKEKVEEKEVKKQISFEILDRKDAIKKNNRVLINSKRLVGSINLKTGSIDDVSLKDYKKSVDKSDSEIVTLLNPKYSKDEYSINICPIEGVKIEEWNVLRQIVDSKKGTHDIFLQSKTNNDIIINRHIRIDENFLFTTTDTVKNNSSSEFSYTPCAEIKRVGTPEIGGYYILHEGLIGYLNKSLEELDYEKIEEKKEVTQNTKGGWIGITDKYWLVSLIPNQTEEVKTWFRADTSGVKKIYTTGYKHIKKTLSPGESAKTVYHSYAGAKELKLLDEYESILGFEHFDLAIDFGWFYFITKPFFFVLTWINSLLGNFGLAIIGLTLLTKLLLFPLANKSYRSMSRMKSFQPKIEDLKKRFGDDKVKLNQEMMSLYKKEKINPASGCLPMLIQAPVFFALYKVLFVSIEMRHSPFYGWIHDLSAPDPTTIFNLFGLIPWDPPSMLQIGLLPLIMGITMWAQQKLNPQPADPTQATMMLIMPVMFTYLFASFPAGLVVYWTANNILSMGQQYAIMKIEESRPEVIPAANSKKKR